MMPLFANPAGLWALLGVPAILAIHFAAAVARGGDQHVVSHRATRARQHAGRTLEKLRTSRQLWLQLLAVLMAAWLLAEPRWILAESAQTVVIVLDSSAAMEAFRAPALAAAEKEIDEDGRARGAHDVGRHDDGFAAATALSWRGARECGDGARALATRARTARSRAGVAAGARAHRRFRAHIVDHGLAGEGARGATRGGRGPGVGQCGVCGCERDAR